MLPTEPRQKRSQEKRRRLKEAALALFKARGYEGTSIEEIAKCAHLATGTFYQHYGSKRQLLLALMDELLAGMERLNLRPGSRGNLRAGLRDLVARGFSGDLRYLGACRAWEEAVLSDPDLARKQQQIRSWTSRRIAALFAAILQWPGARKNVDVRGLAQVVDALFWNLLGQAVRLRRVERNRWIDAATDLIYHALFDDAAAGCAGLR